MDLNTAFRFAIKTQEWADKLQAQDPTLDRATAIIIAMDYLEMEALDD